jgi:tRNA (guanosine-2'-O-)-methyltransferase
MTPMPPGEHDTTDARDAMSQLLDAGGAPPEDDSPFEVAGTTLAPARVVDLLAPLMTEARLKGIRETVARRTRTVVPVIEGIVNTGNVSAVMRSAEALGYQNLHVVAGNHDRFKTSTRTAKGAQRWLDVWRWSGPAACIDHLHQQGYRVLTFALSATARPIEAFDFTAPTALVFGNEKEGVTEAMREGADADCIIPIDGFTESFNISVAAAIALYHARHDRIQRQGHHADLSDAAQTRLVARFCMRSVSNARKVLARRLRDAS